MPIPIPCGPEKIVYESRLFEVVKKPYKIGEKIREFELVRRPPGVRLLIIKDSKILIAREYRPELEGIDYRLPGGKVFDDLRSYKESLEKGEDIEKHAERAAIKESEEETGLIPKSIKLIHKTTPGATVDWTLYYFLIDKVEDGKKALEEGENIETEWHTKDEVIQMCLKSQIREDRTVAVLLKYLSDHTKSKYHLPLEGTQKRQ